MTLTNENAGAQVYRSYLAMEHCSDADVAYKWQKRFGLWFMIRQTTKPPPTHSPKLIRQSLALVPGNAGIMLGVPPWRRGGRYEA